jgi:Kef-type K+ transport system membrane component KefB
MEHLDVPQFLGLLVVMLATAKALGALAQRIGQPAVLGELVAGVLLGRSVLGLVDPQMDVLHLFAELGVIILLFEIGLETNLRQLLQVGGAAAVVALVGVALPFAFGYVVCWMLGFEALVAVVAGATLTATSVGITARVLADLGRLQEPESHIILGAAVIDDVIGLVILAVVTGLTAGETLTVLGVATTAAIAFGFPGRDAASGKAACPALRPRGKSGRSAWYPDDAGAHDSLWSGVAGIRRRVGHDYRRVCGGPVTARNAPSP